MRSKQTRVTGGLRGRSQLTILWGFSAEVGLFMLFTWDPMVRHGIMGCSARDHPPLILKILIYIEDLDDELYRVASFSSRTSLVSDDGVYHLI
jgi:hypothetical protein